MTLRAFATNVCVMLLTITVLAIVVEVGLRITGFSYRLYPEEIEFGRPDPVMIKTGFREDPDLFWVTPDYDAKLQALAETRPPLVLMGDSCTHLGRYDEAMVAVARERWDRALPYGNLGVAGWSSHQGLRQFQRDVVPLAPRVVTVYYGWNDHWIGFGIEDKDVARIKQGGPSSTWQRLRAVQLVTKTRVALRSRDRSYPNRVSLEDFSGNLATMIATARQHAIEPVLITAPSSHVAGEEPEVLATRWLRDANDLVPLHQSYVEAVRAVARDTDAVLCDAAADFAARPRAELLTLMQGDGIHLTPAGDRALAELLVDCLDEANLMAALLDP